MVAALWTYEEDQMTHTLPAKGCWLAFYADSHGFWRVARNALGHPIRCESPALAKSVAAYRRRRLIPFTSN